MKEIVSALYALGIVPTYQWTYRAGRNPDRRRDGYAATTAVVAAALWFVAVPAARLFRKVAR